MTLQEAEQKFVELNEKWLAYHHAAKEMRSKVAAAFAAVANGEGANPTLGVLEILASLEKNEMQLLNDMNELVRGFDSGDGVH